MILDLLCRKLHQVFIDNIADVLKVDGKRDNLHCTATFAIIQALPGDFCDVEFDRFMKFINRIVCAFDLGHQLTVIVHQRDDCLPQHRLNEVSHVQRFPGRTGERQRRRPNRRRSIVGTPERSTPQAVDMGRGKRSRAMAS
jgi:hypothetical protein